jgi:hypothetical protein
MSVAPDGSEIVIGRHVDRRHRFCQCRACGDVSRCTPSNDFFTLPNDPDDAGLLCAGCFNNVASKSVRGAA